MTNSNLKPFLTRKSFSNQLSITAQTLSTVNLQLNDLNDFNNSFIKISEFENHKDFWGFNEEMLERRNHC